MLSLTSSRGALARLVGGAACISFAGVFVRATTVAPTVSAFYRVLIAGAVLMLLCVGRSTRLLRSRAAAAPLLAAGFLFAADLFVWHRSIIHVGPGLATLLGNFQVFVLAIAGIVLFGEQLRWQAVVATLLALTGLAMIVGGDWSQLPPGYRSGVGYGLATALFYASYLLALRAARVHDPEHSPMADLAIVSLVSAAFLGMALPWEGASFAIPTLTDGALLVGLALVAQIGGWMLISSSLAHVPASRVGLALLLQPALAYVWDVVFFGRDVTLTEAAGAAIALAAIYLGSVRNA